jgi:AcrR family transcriptional regulator
MARSKALEPIWARPEPGSRRPRFTREQIASQALAIADAEGFEAVSMRRVAAELGAGTMSLYHYIRGKDDLVALMDDALMGESLVPDDELPDEWREALAAIARKTREVFLRHAWALHSLQGEAAVQGAPIGPNGMRHFEQSLAALAHAPLDTAGKLDLLAIVDDYVFGHVLRAGELRLRRDVDRDEIAAAVEFGMEQLRSGRYPHLEALSRDPAAASITDEGRFDERFERGLQVLLGGATARPDVAGSGR